MIGVELDELTGAQAAYFSIPQEGPFKREHDRYWLFESSIINPCDFEGFL